MLCVLIIILFGVIDIILIFKFVCFNVLIVVSVLIFLNLFVKNV